MCVHTQLLSENEKGYRGKADLLMQGNHKQNMLNHFSDGRIFFHFLPSVGEFHSQSFKNTVTTCIVYRINNGSGIEGSVCKALHVTEQDRSAVYVLCLRWFPLQNPGAKITKTFQLKILFLLKWDENVLSSPGQTALLCSGTVNFNNTQTWAKPK